MLLNDVGTLLIAVRFQMFLYDGCLVYYIYILHLLSSSKAHVSTECTVEDTHNITIDRIYGKKFFPLVQ